MRKSLLIIASFGLLSLNINAQQLADAMNQESVNWQPGTVTYYNWWEEDWLLGVENKYTYDEHIGLITRVVLSDGTIEDREYYDNGYIKSVTISENIDGELTIWSKNVYTYDEIVPDYLIENLYYQLNNNDELVLYNAFRNILTRNTDGNIVENEAMQYYKSKWVCRSKYIINYGDDGRACSIDSETYDLETGEPLAFNNIIWNIVWEETDGQITAQNWQNLMSGTNRIKSAEVYGLDYEAKLTVEYPSEGSYEYIVVQGDDILSSVSSLLMDDMRSYEITSITNNYNVSNSYPPELEFRNSSKSYSKCLLDEYNYPLYVLNETYEDDTLLFSQERTAEPTYDSEYGYPLEYIFSVSLNGAPAEYYQKIVLGDYVQIASVEDVAVDTEAKIEYFNLQGIKVDNPTAGLYIRRQGARTEKILVK